MGRAPLWQGRLGSATVERTYVPRLVGLAEILNASRSFSPSFAKPPSLLSAGQLGTNPNNMNTLSQLVASKVTLQELFNQSHFPSGKPFSENLLKLDCAAETDRICAFIRREALYRFRKKGIVVGLSGGIDSSTVAALAARAVGPHRVLALQMPEKDSSAETLQLSQMMAQHLGIKSMVEDISALLESNGCYRRRDD